MFTSREQCPEWEDTKVWLLCGGKLQQPSLHELDLMLGSFDASLVEHKYPLPFLSSGGHRQSLALNSSFIGNTSDTMSEKFIDYRNNVKCHNVYNNFYRPDDEKAQILAWLSPLEPRGRHRDVRNHRVKGVGNWLLQTEEFL